jgi:hypothetical protein
MKLLTRAFFSSLHIKTKYKQMKYNHIPTLEQLKQNKNLYKHVLRVAQFQSEMELGVNPSNVDQADVSNISKNDIDYINKVCTLAKKRLNNKNWIKTTLQEIDNLTKADHMSRKGTQNNNELFKGGRGILEEHLKKIGKPIINA